MKNNMLIFIFCLLFLFILASPLKAFNYTMSWDFLIFNNPNARQVALNIAEKQRDLIGEEEDPIKNFTDGLERRVYSSIQQEIARMIMDEEEIPYGEFETKNLKIFVAEDPLTGEVIVEVIDIITGDSTIIRYSTDSWGNQSWW